MNRLSVKRQWSQMLVKTAIGVYICVILSQPMAGPVLDTLADTLIPDAMEAKSQTDKPKVTGFSCQQWKSKKRKK